MSNSLFKINLRGLSDGEHRFTLCLDDLFFKGLDASLIKGGRLDAEVLLHRQTNLFRVDLRVDGEVLLDCHRCLEPLTLEVGSQREFFVKFGSVTEFENEECLIIKETDGILDLGWIIYEDAVLNLPIKHVHPEGGCNAEMMAYYSSVEEEPSDKYPKDSGNTSTTSPWDILKDLKFN